MNHSAAHTALVRAILVALSRADDVIATGNTSARGELVRGGYINAGAFAPGAPDILVVVRCCYVSRECREIEVGAMAAIECKTGSGRTSPEQQQCARRLARYGVPTCVARSVDDAVKFVDELRARR